MKLDSSDTRPASGTPISRRGFLKRGAAVATGAAVFPAIIPASAMGADGHVAPSNRIVMGCIGVGSQGKGNMGNFLKRPDAQVVAVCDVDAGHRAEAKNLVNEAYGSVDCKEYNDFRELLTRDDLDALMLALPDHWHSIPAITAAQKGLHMYAEKPLAYSIGEGRAMVDAVNKAGVVWQTGSWQRSQAHFRKGCEIVRSGRIGRVHTVKVGLPTGKTIGPQPEMPVPAGFDYDFWLGPAPWAPYTEKRCHWDFRWILDYSGGQLTDWIGHHGDIANWGMGTELTSPTSIRGGGLFPREGLWDAAIEYTFVCEFPAGVSPVAPDGFTMILSNSFPMGTRFEGTEGWVRVDRGEELETFPATLKDVPLGPNDVHLYESNDHFQNFLDCCRSGEKCVAPIEPAYHAITLGLLGNIAMQLGRELKWDPTTEHFVDDPIADRKLMRPMRAPWSLPV
ncbi:MAG: Gfo/Idh/MocA family oxidoreductase [FCB group bacterium]|jgi:predicted dehydrogenase|nr:Gfo/Idh/MocA family oxidoreductase [FCB group bacterium]